MQATASVASSPSPALPAYALGHFPDAPTTPLPETTARVLQATLDAAVKGGLPGITATVLEAGVGSWSGAAGTADGVHPVEVRSQFAIASLTKTVIAAEVMWLAEQGKLTLSDPVADHLPAGFHFDTNGSSIENLLSMRSGIPDPISEESGPVLANLLKAWTPEELLATVPAYRNPRPASSGYEDANYMLLSLVVGATTGMPVPAALRVHVLADPRFASMVYQPDERPLGPLALPFFGGQVRPNILALGGGYLPSRSESSGGGSGGMASDSGALALWGYQLFGGRIVSEASLRAMTDFGDWRHLRRLWARGVRPDQPGERVRGPGGRQRRLGRRRLLVDPHRHTQPRRCDLRAHEYGGRSPPAGGPGRAAARGIAPLIRRNGLR